MFRGNQFKTTRPSVLIFSFICNFLTNFYGPTILWLTIKSLILYLGTYLNQYWHYYWLTCDYAFFFPGRLESTTRSSQMTRKLLPLESMVRYAISYAYNAERWRAAPSTTWRSYIDKCYTAPVNRSGSGVRQLSQEGELKGGGVSLSIAKTRNSASYWAFESTPFLTFDVDSTWDPTLKQVCNGDEYDIIVFQLIN